MCHTECILARHILIVEMEIVTVTHRKIGKQELSCTKHYRELSTTYRNLDCRRLVVARI